MNISRKFLVLITVLLACILIACGNKEAEVQEVIPYTQDVVNDNNIGREDDVKDVISEEMSTVTPSDSVSDNENAFPDAKIDTSISLADDNDVHGEDKTQIVFLGDSIIDNFRDETGIVYMVGNALNANVYNLGIGGASASVKRDILDHSDEGLKDLCGVTVSNIMAGKVSSDYLIDCTTRRIIESHIEDFKKTDIFIVEYGVNDFLYGRDRTNEDNRYDPNTYEGAIRRIIDNLRIVAPDAKIVLCHPSYIELYRENGEYIGNSHVLDNGLGTECDYGNLLEFIASDCNTYFWPLASQGPCMENSNETLLDGIHLNELGRKMYAENLTKYLEGIIIED